jgi:hypothetical protein
MITRELFEKSISDIITSHKVVDGQKGIQIEKVLISLKAQQQENPPPVTF